MYVMDSTLARSSRRSLSMSRDAWVANSCRKACDGGIVTSRKCVRAVRMEHTGIFSYCVQFLDEPAK